MMRTNSQLIHPLIPCECARFATGFVSRQCTLSSGFAGIFRQPRVQEYLRCSTSTPANLSSAATL
jgi:hypothetical protein